MLALLLPCFSKNTEVNFLSTFGFLYNHSNPKNPICWLPSQSEKEILDFDHKHFKSFKDFYRAQFISFLEYMDYIDKIRMIPLKDSITQETKLIPGCSQTRDMKAITVANLTYLQDLRQKRHSVNDHPAPGED